MKYAQAIILATAATAAVVSAAPTTVSTTATPQASASAVAAPETKPAAPAGSSKQTTTTPGASPKGKGQSHKHGANAKGQGASHKGTHRHSHHPKNKEAKPHHRTHRTGAHPKPAAAKTPSQSTTALTAPGTTSKTPAAPSLTTRELLDILERSLDDMEELEARGKFSGVGRVFSKVRNAAKGHKMNTAIGAASIAATVGSTVGVAQNQQRDFEDLEELYGRDFYDLEELEARGKFSGVGRVFSKVRNAAKGHKMNTAIGAAGIAATVGSTVGVAQRDFEDLEELYGRDFDDLEELEARGKFSGVGRVFSKVRNAAKGHKMNTAIGAASIAATVGSTVGVAQNQQRDFGDLEELDARDYDELEELFDRDFEDLEDLEARGKFSGVARVFNKFRNAAKGHKMDTAIGAASIGATVGSTVGVAQNQQRDFDDVIELDARDLDELEDLMARGKFSAVGRILGKARTAMKGKKMNAAIAGVGVAGAIGSQQPQQRDLHDFDELEMRDFDFDLNELD